MDTQTLTIKLAAEVAEFISKIKGVESLVSGVAQRMRDSFSGLWATLGATVSVAGLGAFVKASINAMDQLDELSQRYGISVKELSGLQLAFKQSGIEQDAMASSMGKLQRAMADGNRGLAAIGVGTRNADGSLRGTSAVLLDVADKFAGLQDGAGKTALAVEIFGKSGADMVPLLNSGSDGIKDMISTAERLGLVLEDEVAAKAGNFNDTLELLGMGAQGVGRGIAARLLPTLQSLAENFLTSMTNGDRLAKTAEFLANILKGLYIAGLLVVEVFSSVGKSFAGVFAQIAAVARGEFSLAGEIGRQVDADLKAGWQETAAQISAAWSGAGGDTVAALAAAGGAAKKHAPDLKALEENAKAAAKALEDQRKEQEAQAKLVAELSGVQADYELSLQRLQAQRDAGNLSEERYIELVTALIAKQPMAKKLMDEQGKTTADLAARQNQAFDDYFERSERERMAVEARIKVGRTTLEQLQFENSLLGLNTTEREVAIAMRELERQGVVKGTEAWDRYAAAIKASVVDRESQREAIGFWDSIQSTAKNVFTDVANNGVSAFERIGKTIKAAVLDLLWQVTGQRWLISLGASMGAPGAANAASSTGGSSLSNAMGFAGTASAFGTGMGAAFTSIVQAGVGGWATAAGSLIGTGTMSGVAAGLGMIAGPLMAVVAVASLLKGLDDSGTLHTGGMASYSAAGGQQTSTEHGAFGMGFGGVERGDQTVGMVSGLTKSIVGILDATAVTFGKTAGYQVATAFADDTSKDGAWGGLLIKGANGQTAVNWNDSRTSRWAPREFADGEAGAKEYGLAVAKDVRTVLIEQTPAWADTMLNALGDAPTLEQLAGTVAQIHAAAAAFDTMGRASEQFASLSESALDALVTAMGGAEAAVAGLGSYMGNFYSEEERTGVLRGQLQDKFTDLGLGDLPQTHAQFRAIVESLDLTTASGRAMYAELIKISPAFHTVATASETAATAMANAATEAARAAEQAMEQARQERQRLEEEATAAANAAMEEATQRVRQFFEAFTGSVEEAANTIEGLSRDIGSYLDGLNAKSGTPTQNLASARQAFDQQMALARSGDRTAMGSITQYADRLISAGEQRLGSIQGQQLIAMVKTQLAALPGQISAEQLIVDAIERQTLAHANTLTTNFARLDTNLDGLLTFDELQSAGLATNGEIGNVIAALDANADGQISAMEAMTGTLVAKFAAIDVNVSGAIDFSEFRTAFAGLGSESTLRGIFTTLDADGDGQISRLEAIQQSTSTTATNTYGLDKLTRIKDVVNSLQWGTDAWNAASVKALATVAGQQNWTASDISAALERFTGQEIADFFAKYGASIGVGGITAGTAAATGTTGGSTTSGFVIGGSGAGAATSGGSGNMGISVVQPPKYVGAGGTAIYDPAAVGRLDSINTYINTLDWGAGANASAWSMYQNAGPYDVTQREIAIAAGMPLESVWALFDAAGVPRFATGAAFRNGVVSRPTMFDIGQMGEDGEEAIMPLANIGGSLGVRYAGPDFGAMTGEMTRALAAMEARLVEANALLASIQASARATNTHAALSANSLGTIVRDGVAVVGTGENVPVIKVEVVTP